MQSTLESDLVLHMPVRHQHLMCTHCYAFEAYLLGHVLGRMSVCKCEVACG